MASANHSPVGFGTILAFHLCVVVSAVLFQNLWLADRPALFGAAVSAGVIGLVLFCVTQRRFVWDMFRSFKSAGVLIGLLILSCIAGTLFIQDLDLRRADVFNKGLAPEGRPYPAFSLDTQSGRFAYAQSFGLLKLFPNEARRKRLAEEVVLSDVEEARADFYALVFGARNAAAYREFKLGEKRRKVEQETAEAYARTNFVSRDYAHEMAVRAAQQRGIPPPSRDDAAAVEKLTGYRGWAGRAGLYDLWVWTRHLHLFDIFESWWFYFLLGLIGVNVVIGTIARAPWSARDLGVAVTHAGILVILTGALLDRLVAKEGYIYFTARKAEHETKIYDAKTRTYTHLPFLLRLDRFATEYYHTLLVERYDWSRRHDGKPWPSEEGPGRMGRPFSVTGSYPVRAGVPHKFANGTVTVTVHEYKPRVFVRKVVRDAEEGELRPAAKIGLYNVEQGGQNFFVHGNTDPWLFAFDPRRDAIERYGARFEYVRARSEAENRRILSEPPVPDNGTLYLRDAGATVQARVELGGRRSLSVGGESLEVEFVDVRSETSDSENVNLDQRLQRSVEPVLFLRINGQSVSVPRDVDAFRRNYHGVELRFDWPNPRDNSVRSIFRVVEGEGMPPMLVQTGAAPRALRPGSRVPLVGLDGGYLELEGAVRSAHEEREVVEVSDEEFLRSGGSDDHLLAAWADVEIRGPWGTVRKELTPYDEPIYYGRDADGRDEFLFALVKANQQRDWFSVLTVVDKAGNDVKSHAVQVNSPLRHRGWRFFQATAATDADGLGVSGISVTYNPGVNFMYVGYAVLTLGVCWIFFYKPIYDRRRRRRREAEAQA